MERTQIDRRAPAAPGSTGRGTRVALYARVSTLDQTCEPHLHDLREYVTARGWQAVEFVDHGISGAKEKRPALDRLLRGVKARKIDVVVVADLGCWRGRRGDRDTRPGAWGDGCLECVQPRTRLGSLPLEPIEECSLSRDFVQDDLAVGHHQLPNLGYYVLPAAVCICARCRAGDLGHEDCTRGCG